LQHTPSTIVFSNFILPGTSPLSAQIRNTNFDCLQPARYNLTESGCFYITGSHLWYGKGME